MDNLAILAIALLAPIFFVALWCGVCWVLSLVGGWHRLAGLYRAEKPAMGESYRLQSGRVGPVSYNQCLRVQAGPDGFYLSVLFLFRPGHPTIFIPWNAVHHPEVKRILWYEGVKFAVGDPPVARLQLPRKIFQNHYPVAGAELPKEEVKHRDTEAQRREDH